MGRHNMHGVLSSWVTVFLNGDKMAEAFLRLRQLLPRVFSAEGRDLKRVAFFKKDTLIWGQWDRSGSFFESWIFFCICLQLELGWNWAESIFQIKRYLCITWGSIYTT